MDIGLYFSAFILIFGAVCWLASVVCAWLFAPKDEPQAPYKVEPHADYLADCEWPDNQGSLLKYGYERVNGGNCGRLKEDV